MKDPLKSDKEYFNLQSKKYYFEKQIIRDAPKFREYILWLWENKDKSDKEIHQDKVRAYMKTYYEKKKRLEND